jgi:hypothetical protein
MAPDLEECEGDCRYQDIPSGISYPVTQRGDMIFEGRPDCSKPREEDAVRRNKAELYEGESGGFGEGIEDGFRGGIGQGAGKVPYQAQRL